MPFSVEFLDPDKHAAVRKGLKIPVNTGESASFEFFFKFVPHILGSKMGSARGEKLDYRPPARRELEPAFFYLF
jgi:hypothetical protein